MRISYDEFLKLIPEYYNKENTIKFIKCFSSVFNYIDLLMEETIGKVNINKAINGYLDYIGNKESALRGNKNDEEYRTFIYANRFIKNNAPTTRNLIRLTESMTGFSPSRVVTNYNNEPASQLIEFDVPYEASDVNFPNLNNYCDAGARIIQAYLQPEKQNDYYNGITDVSKFIDNVEFIGCNII